MQSATSWGLESYNEPTRLRKGEMCSCKIKFQQQWEHGWPEAQLSHFLKRHFLNSSVILLLARQQVHIFMHLLPAYCQPGPRPMPASLSAPTQQLGEFFALSAFSCLHGAAMVDTCALCRSSSALRPYQTSGETAPNTVLITTGWNALHTQCRLYASSAVLAAVKYMDGNSKESQQQCGSCNRSRDAPCISSYLAGLSRSFLISFSSCLKGSLLLLLLLSKIHCQINVMQFDE